jgi:hypothetical protein
MIILINEHKQQEHWTMNQIVNALSDEQYTALVERCFKDSFSKLYDLFIKLLQNGRYKHFVINGKIGEARRRYYKSFYQSLWKNDFTEKFNLFSTMLRIKHPSLVASMIENLHTSEFAREYIEKQHESDFIGNYITHTNQLDSCVATDLVTRRVYSISDEGGRNLQCFYGKLGSDMVLSDVKPGMACASVVCNQHQALFIGFNNDLYEIDKDGNVSQITTIKDDDKRVMVDFNAKGLKIKSIYGFGTIFFLLMTNGTVYAKGNIDFMCGGRDTKTIVDVFTPVKFKHEHPHIAHIVVGPGQDTFFIDIHNKVYRYKRGGRKKSYFERYIDGSKKNALLTLPSNTIDLSFSSKAENDMYEGHSIKMILDERCQCINGVKMNVSVYPGNEFVVNTITNSEGSTVQKKIDLYGDTKENMARFNDKMSPIMCFTVSSVYTPHRGRKDTVVVLKRDGNIYTFDVADTATLSKVHTRITHDWVCYQCGSIKSGGVVDPYINKPFCHIRCLNATYNSIDRLVMTSLDGRKPTPFAHVDQLDRISELKKQLKQLRRIRIEQNKSIVDQEIRIIEEKIVIEEKIINLLRKRYALEEKEEEYSDGGQAYQVQIQEIDEDIERLKRKEASIPPPKMLIDDSGDSDDDLHHILSISDDDDER